MATINILSCGNASTHKSLREILKYCMQEAKTSQNGTRLVTGINCSERDPYLDMMLTKKTYGKTGGRAYYHMDQSFSPDEKITPELAHKIAVEYAEEQFKGYEVIVATHVDAHHIHSHFVVNSVSFENGLKYHSSQNNIQKLRDASDAICLKYGLSIVEPKEKKTKDMGTREFRAAREGKSWKADLIYHIEMVMRKAKSKEDFLRMMKERGYQVTWTDNRKYITYTTPDGYRCRDNKLHETKFLKEVMEHEFRIREEIRRNQDDYQSKVPGSREADTLLHDHRRELESTSGRIERTTGFDERDGQSRGDGVVFQPIERNLQAGSQLVEPEGRTIEERDGEPVCEMERGNDRTGWEDERAICFGFGGNEERNGETGTGEFGQTVSPDLDALPAYDLVGSSAYLAADLMNMIDTQPQGTQDTFQYKPKKEKKNNQKKDQQGPTMSM